MPISTTRCDTVYDITPYIPTAASSDGDERKQCEQGEGVELALRSESPTISSIVEPADRN
jgi:hypothetical protein